jgi:exopolyphosphatase/guanosine-5'-triphosphate,3'-diphosphate pyrophosphatase
MLGYPAPDNSQDTVAAVDLGSNSFHMVVARLDQGRLQILDRLREPVRLGEGLTSAKHLDPEVAKRALECLARFGQRLKALPPALVRAVGTNTLRQVDDGGAFLHQAEQALGHEIDVIAGREEARLIYAGVAHGLPAGDERRLVVDIGGGSTEVIIGRGMDPLERESLFMGCVSMTRQCFADGSINERNMKQAVTAAGVELHPLRTHYRELGWDQAVGSSGTIKAIARAVQAAGWCSNGISRAALAKLRKALVKAGHYDNLKLEGISDDRIPLLAGGVAVLSGLFEVLNIEHMAVSGEALREGLLYEMLGQIRHEDIRDRTVQSLMQRFDVDAEQAGRVRTTALALLAQVAEPWSLANPEDSQMLGWAARLHELGLAIAHSGHHKHGAYVLANADLPGFSRQDQTVLAMLVRCHRRKISNAQFNGLDEVERNSVLRLGLLLRLAVLLHRGRNPQARPLPTLAVEEQALHLTFPEGQLDERPLTLAELAREADYLANVAYRLGIT